MVREHSAIHGLTQEDSERWFDDLSRRVCVDFDGTLHPYTNGWTGSIPDDEPPIPGSREFIASLRMAGFDPWIYSSRADHEEGRIGIINWMRKWYGEAFCVGIQVTHEKVGAVAYVDDRAVEFRPHAPNYDECLARVQELAKGRAWNAAAPADVTPNHGGSGEKFCPTCGRAVGHDHTGDFVCEPCGIAWAPTLGHLLYDRAPTPAEMAQAQAGFYDTSESGM